MHGEGLVAGVIMLGAALVSVIIFRRFGLGATLGYLVAGAVIGPHVLGLVGDPESKLGVAELGITLLLFLVGLELSPRRLWELRRDIFGFGMAQVILCGAAVSVIVWQGTNFSLPASIALGLPLALSSTAQVLPMLQSAGRLHTPFGERAFSILLLQDLSLIPLITIISALSRAPLAPGTPPGWVLALYTVGAIVGLVLVGRYVLTPLFRLIGGMGERELFVAAGLFCVLASAAVMQWLHLSTALGAFIAGVMLADSPYRHELEADIEPFRAVLLGLFFVAVGMMLDLDAVVARPFFVVGMALALIATKAAIIFLIARIARMEWRTALALGLLLSQGGEFGFVLFAQAQKALLIEPQAASLFGAIVTLSMATTPFLMMISRRFRGAPAKLRTDLEGPSSDGATAIIVGYGRFGQTVAQLLTAHKLAVTLIDWEAEQIDVSASFAVKVYYGDGRRVDLLRLAGASEAQLILFCQDGDPMEADHLATVAEAFPEAKIFVRVFDRRQVLALYEAPISGAVREVFESAVIMARQALEALDVEVDEIDDAEARYRDVDHRRLVAQAESGDLYAAREVMLRPRADRSVADEPAA